MRLIACLAMLMLIVVGAKLAGAAEPSLEIGLGGVMHRFTASELLARPDATEVDIPDDHDYRRLTTPLINTPRHYTRPRVRENNGCWSSSRVNASISGCSQRSGIVGIRS